MPKSRRDPINGVPAHPISEFTIGRLTRDEYVTIRSALAHRIIRRSRWRITWAMEGFAQGIVYSDAVPDDTQRLEMYRNIADLALKLRLALSRLDSEGNRSRLKTEAVAAMGSLVPHLRGPLERLYLFAELFREHLSRTRAKGGKPPDTLIRDLLEVLHHEAVRSGAVITLPSHEYRELETPFIKFVQAVIEISIRRAEDGLPSLALTPLQRQNASKLLKKYRGFSTGYLSKLVEPIRSSYDPAAPKHHQII